MKHNHSNRRRRFLAPLVLAAAATPILAPAAWGQTWTSRVNGSFGNPANWENGQVPVSSPTTELYFTNLGHSSYRAFNDLGVLTVGGITVETRTNTATFVGQNAGSAIQFGAGAFLRSLDQGLWRFGGVAGVTNDMRLMGNLVYDGSGYGNIFVASPVTDAAGFIGSITVNHNAPTEIHPFLRLEGANTFTGGVMLNQGNLQIGNAGALGSGVLTANGGTFRTTASMTVPNPVLTNQPLKLHTDAGFTLSGVISGPGGVDMRSIGGTASAVTLTAANTYTGPTVIDLGAVYDWGGSGFFGIGAGSIVVSGAAGSIVNSSNHELRNGAVLQINNAAGVINRLKDTGPVNLTNARLHAVGHASINTNERFGPLSVNGLGLVFIAGANGGVTLSTPSLTRGDHATVMLTMQNVNSKLAVDTAPTLTNGIVPWMAGITGNLFTSPRDLITYESGAYRTLVDAEYAMNDLNAGATANVKVTTNLVNNATVDVNALVVGTSTIQNISITGTGTIRPTSGAVVLVNNVPITNNIDFGTAEGIIHVGAISILDGVISGSNGLIKSGDFSLTTSAAHTYTGTTYINGGGFRYSHPNGFDTTDGFVVRSLGGNELVPSLDYRGPGTSTVNKPANVASGVMRLAANVGGLTNALDYTGVISGPGAVYLESGRVNLKADNTYLGGTRIIAAQVELNRDSNLGAPTGALEIAGTAGQGIVLTGDWTSSRTIRVLGTATMTTNGFNVTWNGDVESNAGFNKIGLGTLRMTGYGFTSSAAAWAVGSSPAAAQGGRVEIDGDTRWNWSVWNGVLAVDGTVGRTSVFNFEAGSIGRLAPGDIGGPGVGIMEASFLSLARGTFVEFDLGADSDLIRSITSLSRGSGTGLVTFDFRVGPGIAQQTYTLVEYFEDPSAASIFLPADFTFISNVPELMGVFDLIVRPDGVKELTFTVTAVPEPASVGVLGVALVALARRRRVHA